MRFDVSYFRAPMRTLCVSLLLSAAATGVAHAQYGPEWVRCAEEHGVCKVPYPTTVRYMAKDSFVDRAVNRPIECNNRAFGSDPWPGKEKACYYQARNNFAPQPRYQPDPYAQPQRYQPAPPPPRAEGGRGCPPPGSVRSTNANEPAVMTFANSTNRPLKIFWLDYNGQRKFYRDLAPGQTYRQSTYVTHPWIAVDPRGTCVSGVQWPRRGQGMYEFFGD